MFKDNKPCVYGCRIPHDLIEVRDDLSRRDRACVDVEIACIERRGRTDTRPYDRPKAHSQCDGPDAITICGEKK